MSLETIGLLLLVGLALAALYLTLLNIRVGHCFRRAVRRLKYARHVAASQGDADQVDRIDSILKILILTDGQD